MDSDFFKCESNVHTKKTRGDRFCCKCEKILCCECVLDYHSSHPQDAGLKIEDLLDNQKLLFDKMLTKTIDTETSRIIDSGLIIGYLDKIEHIYNTNVKHIERLKEELNQILQSEHLLYQAVKYSLDKYSEKSLQGFAYENLLKNKKQLEIIEEEWPSKSKSDKLKLLKSSKSIEKDLMTKLDEFLLEPNYIKEFNSVLDLFSKQKYKDELNKIKILITEMNSKVVLHRQLIENKRDNVGTITYDDSDGCSTDNSFTLLSKLSNITTTVTPSLLTLNKSTLKSNYKYLINYSRLEKTVIIIDPDISINKTQVIKFDESCFTNKNIYNGFSNIQEKSHVNLGDSLLLTGGSFKSQSRANSYLLKVTKLDNVGYKISVSEYSKLIEARYFHNAIYLEDVNSVLVCGGEIKSSAEITDLTLKTWKAIKPLNEIRSNSTLLYYNHKIVYCFGGVGEDGTDLDTCESIDIKNINAEWKFIKIVKEIGYDFKYNTMGVIQIDNSRIILLGSIKNLKTDAGSFSEAELLIENDRICKISRRRNLQENLVFHNQNNFIRWDHYYLNCDINLNIAQYNIVNEEFKIIKRSYI